MRKYIIPVCLLGSLLIAAPAYAGGGPFKNAARAAENWTRLQNALTRASARPLPARTITAPVPRRVIPTGRIVISAVEVPTKQTPANLSFIREAAKIERQLDNFRAFNFHVPTLMARAWGVAISGYSNFGRGFYDDQTQLAQDLDHFYGGAGPLYQLGDKLLRMYALPVDGILYQPAGYSQPVVLKSDEYFVLYDVKAETGQLAQNIPEVYNSFTPYSQNPALKPLQENYARVKAQRDRDENNALWEAIGGEMGYHTCEALLSRDVAEFYYQQARLTALKNSGIEGDLQELVEMTPRTHRVTYPIYAPQMYDLGRQTTGYVYEIPVNGISYYEKKYNTKIAVDPQRYAVFHVPGQEPVLLEREWLEDPTLFRPVP